MHRLGTKIVAMRSMTPIGISAALGAALTLFSCYPSVAESSQLALISPQRLVAKGSIVRVACTNEQGYRCANTAQECYANGSRTHGGLHGQPLATKCGEEWDACIAQCGGLPPHRKRTDY
jgi:hypothetical protein